MEDAIGSWVMRLGKLVFYVLSLVRFGHLSCAGWFSSSLLSLFFHGAAILPARLGPAEAERRTDLVCGGRRLAGEGRGGDCRLAGEGGGGGGAAARSVG